MYVPVAVAPVGFAPELEGVSSSPRFRFRAMAVVLSFSSPFPSSDAEGGAISNVVPTRDLWYVARLVG